MAEQGAGRERGHAESRQPVRGLRGGDALQPPDRTETQPCHGNLDAGILLRGEGRVFTAGYDLVDFTSREPNLEEVFLAEYGLIRTLSDRSPPRELPARKWTYHRAQFPSGMYPAVGAEIAALVAEHGVRTPVYRVPPGAFVADILATPPFGG